MRKINVFILSVLAAVLLSSTFFSMASAQEETEPEPLIAPAPDSTTIPDDSPRSSIDNSTISEDDNQTYHVLEENEAGNLIAPAPAGENADLISAQTDPDYAFPIGLIVVISAVLVGAILGIVYQRKQAEKTIN
jgi:hypothetical protein